MPDETPQKKYLVLPMNPGANKSDEWSEMEFNSVAGGK